MTIRQRLTERERLVGCRAQLPQRLVDGVEGDHDRLPARRLHRPAPQQLLQRLFITHAPAGVKLIENAIVGPIIAILSFVCSVGNVPLAAVLWSGGISFAGVIAFIFADLIVLPIVAIYRKYYGNAYALRIVALMFVTMVIAALIVDGLFSGAGLIPHARPTRADIFSSIKVDYKLFTNVLGVAVFAALFALTDAPRRRPTRSAA